MDGELTIMSYEDYTLLVCAFLAGIWSLFAMCWAEQTFFRFTMKIFANIQNKQLAMFLRFAVITFITIILANIFAILFFYESLPFKDTLDKILSFI
ncbi:hypothetical protein CCY99_08350 [Helicobacter sp. 16-1353]|uniref:hypothetical protein n=1 Tax=Helicobacter sp. 16-1353 TaxID=2004996 RepID=UPI000DCC830D|nr:hypothetical protein [Helicobacter sp. 16-1353]RAX51801.1 hypothetical protein CCY99_08350 [Helicobacter sp. 16-1353]